MRSYGQYCSVAKALDVIGDRWSLLIVRELLLRGSCRYTDLLHGLPGIATNLLGDRLRDLEESGVLRRTEAPPPVASTLYELTARGEELAPVLYALGHWGSDLMVGTRRGDRFRSHWLAFPIEHFLTDTSPSLPAVAIELRTGDAPVTIETKDGAVRARPGTVDRPDAVISGPPNLILGVLTRRLDLAEAKRRGLTFTGKAGALRRIQPAATSR